MEPFLYFLKYLSIAISAFAALLGLVAEHKNDKKELTFAGKLSLMLLAFSTLGTIAIQTVEVVSEREKRDSERGRFEELIAANTTVLTRLERVATQTSRLVEPLGQLTVSYSLTRLLRTSDWNGFDDSRAAMYFGVHATIVRGGYSEPCFHEAGSSGDQIVASPGHLENAAFIFSSTLDKQSRYSLDANGCDPLELSVDPLNGYTCVSFTAWEDSPEVMEAGSVVSMRDLAGATLIVTTRDRGDLHNLFLTFGKKNFPLRRADFRAFECDALELTEYYYDFPPTVEGVRELVNLGHN